MFLSGQDAYQYSVAAGTLQKLTTGIRAATLSLSQDGSRLALLGNVSNSFNLRAVYWRDLATTTNRLIAAAPSTTQNRFANVSISGDGRRVAFDSNFVPPGFTDTNGTNDVFAFDLASGVLTRVSSAGVGDPAGNAASDTPVLSADGGLVVFRSFADDLVAGDTNCSPAGPGTGPWAMPAPRGRC
jgi:Tol biopolymer transport system component